VEHRVELGLRIPDRLYPGARPTLPARRSGLDGLVARPATVRASGTLTSKVRDDLGTGCQLGGLLAAGTSHHLLGSHDTGDAKGARWALQS